MAGDANVPDTAQGKGKGDAHRDVTSQGRLWSNETAKLNRIGISKDSTDSLCTMSVAINGQYNSGKGPHNSGKGPQPHMVDNYGMSDMSDMCGSEVPGDLCAAPTATADADNGGVEGGEEGFQKTASMAKFYYRNSYSRSAEQMRATRGRSRSTDSPDPFRSF